MKPKKSKKADLERSKGLFLEIGTILVLALLLIAFEWNTHPEKDANENLIFQNPFDVEEMQVTLRNEPKTEPVIQQKVTEILNIVDDNVIINDIFDFNVEAHENTRFDFSGIADYIEDKFEDDQPFITVEDMPTFNGGKPEIEFRKYIAANLQYPDIAAENGIGGRVIVQFIINSKGNVVDAKVVSGVDPALDKEAMRVIMSSPAWTPGKQRGKPVKVIFTFPINFVLQ
jgi:protein TonB